MRNFVPNLQIRSKWYKVRTNVSIGDIVLCIDPLSKRSNWQMVIITNTFPGIGNNVRSMEVKTSIALENIFDLYLKFACCYEEYESNV